jgi:aminoglycoside 2'-N-acetyltransferase I
MVEVYLAEPGELAHADLEAAESLVLAAFGANFRSHDWLHGIDGVHVMITVGGELAAHASVVPRTLTLGETSFETGYVEGVAVRPDRQGHGLGRIVMDHAESVIAGRHHIGALNAVDAAASFYASRGWGAWTGPTCARGPDGLVDTYAPDDRIFVFPQHSGVLLGSAMPLVCDWRDGDLW